MSIKSELSTKACSVNVARLHEQDLYSKQQQYSTFQI